MSVIEQKIHRLGSGGRPRVLDLFSGCGGISLGFDRAGFEVIGAIDIDPEAAMTHGRAFHLADLETHGAARSIIDEDPLSLLEVLRPDELPQASVDVIVGGPPCQSFARVGRAKLREVHAHPEAFRHDPRAALYIRYLSYVTALEPLAIVVENVPDVINHAGHNVPGEMCETLTELGYECRYSLMNAAHFGVPQMRDRMILIGYRRELGSIPVFPMPTHQVDLPRGYHGTRSVALKHVRAGCLGDPDAHFVEPLVPHPDLPPAVTAREALADLPQIDKHLRGEMRRGPARFDEQLPYRSDVAPSGYAETMRAWPGFESPGFVCDHVIRFLPRDYPIFRRMAPGDQYPQAHAIAERMLVDAAGKAGISPSAADWEVLRRSIVPPYDPTKFPNKWRKMEADLPARTLMAHIGKDTYSHIHYDSAQARTISVREAARLQSFPDGFFFAGRMNAALRQIGNAVPPLLAHAIALTVRESLAAVHETAPRLLAA